MEVVWAKGPSTVHQILESLPEQPALAYNSVLTTIRILEKKGYVGHAKDGRAHVYKPLIGRQEARRFAVRNLVSRFFQNSHDLLVLNVLEERGVDAEELKRVRALLREGAEGQ